MRLELLWNWRLLCERLAVASIRQRRLRKLRNTTARNLKLEHIDSLELLEMARAAGVNVIYDVGANIGTWTLLARAIIPGATIEAFEPLPAHHSKFMQNCDQLSGISLHRVALGSKNATLPLRVTDFSDASSFLPVTKEGQERFGLKEVAQVSVTSWRLENYCTEKKLPLPDLIKLDVQGFELEVLSGAIPILASVKALIVELSFVQLYQDQCMFLDVCNAMEKYGFRLHALGSITPVGEPLVQADALFMKRE